MTTKIETITITDQDIIALRCEARAAGDAVKARLCADALRGDLIARRSCEQAIRDAAAMVDE